MRRRGATTPGRHAGGRCLRWTGTSNALFATKTTNTTTATHAGAHSEEEGGEYPWTTRWWPVLALDWHFKCTLCNKDNKHNHCYARRRIQLVRGGRLPLDLTSCQATQKQPLLRTQAHRVRRRGVTTPGRHAGGRCLRWTAWTLSCPYT